VRAGETLGMGGAGGPHDNACDIVAEPWETATCSYLAKSANSMGGGE
jgi:hypothetical protein